MIRDILVIVSAVPLGFLLAWLAREELVVGRIWFQRLIIVSIVVGSVLWAYGLREGMLIGGFLAILAFIAYHQSFDRRWIKDKV